MDGRVKGSPDWINLDDLIGMVVEIKTTSRGYGYRFVDETQARSYQAKLDSPEPTLITKMLVYMPPKSKRCRRKGHIPQVSNFEGIFGGGQGDVYCDRCQTFYRKVEVGH